MKIFCVFLFVALTITGLHLFFHPVRVLGMDTSIFYMDEKYTLAAFFSTVTAFLIGFIVLTKTSKTIFNTVYGIFFICLSIDEYFEIHEYANTLIKAALTQDNLIRSLSNFSWIFPLSFIVIGVFVMFVMKIKRSLHAVRRPLIIGSLCFITVLIFELLGSAVYGNPVYVYFVAVEEGMEMVGISYFLLATLLEGET